MHPSSIIFVETFWFKLGSNYPYCNPKLLNLYSLTSITALKDFMVLLFCKPPWNILVPYHRNSGLENKYFDNSSTVNTLAKNGLE